MCAELSRLKEIGFRSAGCWNCDNAGLRFAIDEQLATASNVLYAFAEREIVLYIGKSVRTLKQRLQSYKTPGATQWTNLRNNKNLREAITSGRQIEIFVLPDNGLLKYGGFHINLAAGLEDSLIRELQPPWNGGKKSDDEAAQEIVAPPQS